MEKVQMNDITKQGEETHVEWRIKWRIMGNPVLSGESTPETILTIHPDGRVTISDKLKPTEIAALVLDQIKTQWMRDGQATKIMEMQERIKLLEEAGDEILRDNQDMANVNRWWRAKEAKL
jgi:hypothetical protein